MFPTRPTGFRTTATPAGQKAELQPENREYEGGIAPQAEGGGGDDDEDDEDDEDDDDD